MFILADDLGIGDTKCYGGDRCLIDRNIKIVNLTDKRLPDTVRERLKSSVMNLSAIADNRLAELCQRMRYE